MAPPILGQPAPFRALHSLALMGFPTPHPRPLPPDWNIFIALPPPQKWPLLPDLMTIKKGQSPVPESASWSRGPASHGVDWAQSGIGCVISWAKNFNFQSLSFPLCKVGFKFSFSPVNARHSDMPIDV